MIPPTALAAITAAGAGELDDETLEPENTPLVLAAAPDPSPPCGYIGFTPGTDDHDHSQATGPDTPALQPDDRTRAVQPSTENP